MIRVESEETQHSVREAKSSEHEEGKEKEWTFVPSAVSVPLKHLFRCETMQRKDTHLLAAGVGGAE